MGQIGVEGAPFRVPRPQEAPVILTPVPTIGPRVKEMEPIGPVKEPVSVPVRHG